MHKCKMTYVPIRVSTLSRGSPNGPQGLASHCAIAEFGCEEVLKTLKKFIRNLQHWTYLFINVISLFKLFSLGHLISFTCVQKIYSLPEILFIIRLYSVEVELNCSEEEPEEVASVSSLYPSWLMPGRTSSDSSHQKPCSNIPMVRQLPDCGFSWNASIRTTEQEISK